MQESGGMSLSPCEPQHCPSTSKGCAAQAMLLTLLWQHAPLHTTTCQCMHSPRAHNKLRSTVETKWAPLAGLGTRCMQCECTSRKGSVSMQVVARDILIAGESGIFTPEDVAFVQSTGCGAILVGESLVKTGDPAAAVKTLLSQHQ